MQLAGKKIVLAISGSIAAYKTPHLVRLLIKAGTEVRVITTTAAEAFVSPLALATVSKHPVYSNVADGNAWNNHVELGRWADAMLIAPCSANTLAKMANGICDNLLCAVYLSAICPVFIAPAMDEDMWLHQSTKNNLDKVRSYGNHIIPVTHGELASGLVGEGRMAEPEAIVSFLESGFFLASKESSPLYGKKALVTAGPTYEPLDPVRFIGNHSSGKMGVAIANELAKRGADVTLVLGPASGADVNPGIRKIQVTTAAEMFDACLSVFEKCDLAIMAAAVADYTPVTVAKQKIKKTEGSLTIELTKTKDILKSLGENKKEHQVLAGFALETSDEKANAIAKLKGKNANMIVLNSLNDEGAGFGHDTNKITIFGKSGEEINFPSKPKQEVAKDIIDTIIRLHYA